MNLTRCYLRASTDAQDASRARGQVEAFAVEHGLTIVGTYLEHELGAKLQRPELFRLLADSKAIRAATNIGREMPTRTSPAASSGEGIRNRWSIAFLHAPAHHSNTAAQRNVPGEQRGWSPKAQDARLVAGAPVQPCGREPKIRRRRLISAFAGLGPSFQQNRRSRPLASALTH